MSNSFSAGSNQTFNPVWKGVLEVLLKSCNSLETLVFNYCDIQYKAKELLDMICVQNGTTIQTLHLYHFNGRCIKIVTEKCVNLRDLRYGNFGWEVCIMGIWKVIAFCLEIRILKGNFDIL